MTDENDPVIHNLQVPGGDEPVPIQAIYEQWKSAHSHCSLLSFYCRDA